MYRGRVFIGDGSPTTLCYYTVMPPNNYIPGIFPGYNRISTSFGKLHPNLFCLLGPLQPIGPRLAHLHSVNKIPFASPEALTLRRLPLLGLRLRNLRPSLRRRRPGLHLSSLIFAFTFGASVFAVGASIFVTLRFSSSSPVAPRSSP